jgi:hypothetical protein
MLKIFLVFSIYEENKAKDVEFMKLSIKEFFGTETLFKDDSGN